MKTPASLPGRLGWRHRPIPQKGSCDTSSFRGRRSDGVQLAMEIPVIAVRAHRVARGNESAPKVSTAHECTDDL